MSLSLFVWCSLIMSLRFAFWCTSDFVSFSLYPITRLMVSICPNVDRVRFHRFLKWHLPLWSYHLPLVINHLWGAPMSISCFSLYFCSPVIYSIYWWFLPGVVIIVLLAKKRVSNSTPYCIFICWYTSVNLCFPFSHIYLFNVDL